jgi:DNA-binding NarL/FixJ family response regulator
LGAARRKSDSTPPPLVRVLCVDDHAVLVEGLKAHFAIRREIQCVGYLPTAESLVEEVERFNPDVVMLDIDMPGPDIFEIADRLHQKHPKTPFIFLSAHVRHGYLSAAYGCGASGYFAKGDDLDDIVLGVKQVASRADGAFVMGPNVKKHCVPPKGKVSRARSGSGNQADLPPRNALETLTLREIEIVRLIGKAQSRTEIAEELSISAKTVDGHQDRIKKKLNIESREELVRFAIREGLAEA